MQQHGYCQKDGICYTMMVMGTSTSITMSLGIMWILELGKFKHSGGVML